MQNCWVGQRPFQFCNPQIESISGWRWLDGHPMQNDGFGFQGFPWCYSAWKLLNSLRLSRMFISSQNVPRLSVSVCHVSSWTTPFATCSVEWLVLHGANECHIRDDSPDLWVHRRFPCKTTHIMHLESRLCRFDVAPVRFLRSNELFRHHTPSSRSRKDSYHKRRHQGSR